MKKSGAEILIESLIRENVTHLFGYPGGVILGVYDVLFSSPLQHFFVRHEQGGVHAADGYARASGRPGVALVTSGPGATNAVTGHRHGLHGLDPARRSSPARCRRS